MHTHIYIYISFRDNLTEFLLNVGKLQPGSVLLYNYRVCHKVVIDRWMILYLQGVFVQKAAFSQLESQPTLE